MNKSKFIQLGVIITLLLNFVVADAFTRDKTTQKLKAAGKLGISVGQCTKIESKVGQLLYVNVDNFGYEDGTGKPIETDATHPLYIKMVNDYNIGGVIFHSTARTLGPVVKATTKLREAAHEPLLIGIDDYTLFASEEDQQNWKDRIYKTPPKNDEEAFANAENVARFGLGFSYGFTGKNGHLPKQCLDRISYLDAALHKMTGINHSLGPTIEQNCSESKNEGYKPGILCEDADTVAPIIKTMLEPFNHFGIITTMKHFPYTPEDFNLHNKFSDVKLEAESVLKRIQIFKHMSGLTDFTMTTHLYNSLIDPIEMTTFSSTWINMLREHAGFDGIVLTDGLFMLRSFINGDNKPLELMIQSWPHDQYEIINEGTIFALRSLLSGHDMVFFEGTLQDTNQQFENIVEVACQDLPISKQIRERIHESYERLITFKAKNAEKLNQTIMFPEYLVNEVIQQYNNKKVCDVPSAAYEDLKSRIEGYL